MRRRAAIERRTMMFESFITAFIIYFVVIDPIGNAPIFMAVTSQQNRTQKIKTAVEGTAVATAIMLFFALCGSFILHYLNITTAAFKIAGGLILFTVALDMLTSKRQARKEKDTVNVDAGEGGKSKKQAHQDQDNIAIFPLAIPLLAGPAAIMSVMVVSADLGNTIATQLTGYAALLAVMLATGLILSLTAMAENYIDPRATNVFSRITAIILAALSVQYVIDGLSILGLI